MLPFLRHGVRMYVCVCMCVYVCLFVFHVPWLTSLGITEYFEYNTERCAVSPLAELLVSENKFNELFSNVQFVSVAAAYNLCHTTSSLANTVC